MNVLLEDSDHLGWDDKYQKQADGSAWSDDPQPLVNEFLSTLPSDSQLVDLGAGDGRNSLCALDENNSRQVTLLDISPTALDLALKRFRASKKRMPTAVVGSLEQMPLADAQFDAAICMDTLPQLKNLERGICEIHRIIKHHGKCLVNVFSRKDCAFGEGERVSPSSYVYKGCYFSFFEENDLPQLCAGKFVVERCEHLNWEDPPHVPFRPYPHRHDAFFYVLKKI